ncbi:MAG: histidine kinase [Atopobiaceae bacterium]|nr:histidine kinase [Atopobiaceae bacterium]
MIDWEAILYIFLGGAMTMLSVLGLESAIVAPSMDRWSKRFFTAFFTVLVLSSATIFLELVAYVYPNLTLLEIIAYYLQSLLDVIPFPMLAVYLLRCCGEDWQSSPLFRAVLALGAVCVILFSLSLFSPLFYSITPDGQIHLGPAYPLLIVPVLAILLLIAAGVIRRRDKLSQQYYRAFLVCLLPVTLAIVIHMFVPVFLLINVGLTISAFSMYRIIESDSIEQNLRQQQKIANQRASIAVLQMRPHFIYNTMTSIYYLCDENPELAKQVTLDFTTYLRKNFTAIASKENISFSEELEHTRAYLAVEQAQFEDGLLVDYDTPHTQFRVPPLTLQPIVENAVKHGMDPDLGPLHIRIQTRETDSDSEVIVEDDGSGFDPAIAEKPHTTLANIRQRLEMMCHGTMSIAPRKGGGTVVKVTIPQRG